jgi:hypothetical protein
MAENIMRVLGIAIAVEAGVEHSDLASRPPKLQRRRKPGKAATNDDHVLHRMSPRVRIRGGCIVTL